jgi:hypothetical protein
MSAEFPLDDSITKNLKKIAKTLIKPSKNSKIKNYKIHKTPYKLKKSAKNLKKRLRKSIVFHLNRNPNLQKVTDNFIAYVNP